jgi:hypothetical protein
MNKLPEAAAKECSERYPVKESIDSIIVVDSAALQNYQNELFLLWKQLDSVLSIGCDTITKVKINEIIKTLPAKTETKVITRTVENTAKMEVLKNDCDKTIKSLSESNTQNVNKLHQLELKVEKLKRRNIWLWLIIIALTVFSFRKQLIRGL